MKVEAQLSALKSYVNCELSILRNQIESLTEHTKMLLGHDMNSIDMFYECEESDIENYTDDITPYVCASDINAVISELQGKSQ